ncbi:MAG: hypothetical protein ACREN5_07645, partial [Gemmatimonadales bacterium]
STGRPAVGVIPDGFAPTGHGYCVDVAVEIATFDADAVVSSPVIAGPFLVVACMLRLAASTSAMLTVVDAPVRVAAVLNTFLPRVGKELFSIGPEANLEAGAGEEPPIGDVEAAVEGQSYWPWYVHERAGALALWLRNHSALGPVKRGFASVSVWQLERVTPEARIRSGEVFPLLHVLEGPLGPVPYVRPHAAAWNGQFRRRAK